MKNNRLKYFLSIFFMIFFQNLYAEEVYINASKVEIDKNNQKIYAEGNVEIYDKFKNTIFAEKAEYDKLNGIVKTIGKTRVVTSEKYEVDGNDIFYDEKKRIIYSQYETKIEDINKNLLNKLK